MDPDPPMHEVTRILEAIQGGNLKAADDLLPIVYDELRRLAALKLSQEKPGQTLQATALVHEAYIRLVGTGDPGWKHRGHFFAAAAEAIRRILVERARSKNRIKRGGRGHRLPLEDLDLGAPESCEDLLALDEALAKLAVKDPQKAELVKLRCFVGLTNAEAAEAVGVSSRTADRYWRYARAWLVRAITGGGVTEPS